jgi:hypothetical protein
MSGIYSGAIAIRLSGFSGMWCPTPPPGSSRSSTGRRELGEALELAGILAVVQTDLTQQQSCPGRMWASPLATDITASQRWNIKRAPVLSDEAYGKNTELREDGMSVECAIGIDNLRTVPKALLTELSVTEANPLRGATARPQTNDIESIDKYRTRDMTSWK